MKKLLKSILIATASVGAVAGTTAAVVSCGEASALKDPANKVMETMKITFATGITPTGTGDDAKKNSLVDTIAAAVLGLVDGLKKAPTLPAGAPDCSKIDTTKITNTNFTVVSYTAWTSKDNGSIELTWKVFGTDGSTATTDKFAFMVLESH